MRSCHRRAAIAAVSLCLAMAFSSHRAEAQVVQMSHASSGATGDERTTYAPRAPGVAAAGVALTLAGVPLLVGGTSLLADGVARDERQELSAIDDLETSGGVLLLGGGAILVGAGVPTIVWGLLPDEPDEPETRSGAPADGPAPTSIAVHPGGAAATWRF